MHWPYCMVVIGSREKRGVGEEFVGSYLYQVHLYGCLESNDYGRLLSGNTAHTKVKQLVCRFADRIGQLRSKRNFCAGYTCPASSGTGWIRTTSNESAGSTWRCLRRRSWR